MVAPIIGKAAVETVKLVSKGFASKGAESIGKGMKSLGDNSRDFLAATMAMEQVGKAFHVNGPAMGILSAQFKSATMGTRIALMSSLISLVQTEGFQLALTILTTFFNNVVNTGTAISDFLTEIDDSTVLVTLRTAYTNLNEGLITLNESMENPLGFFNVLFGLGKSDTAPPPPPPPPPPPTGNWLGDRWNDLIYGIEELKRQFGWGAL